MATRLKRKFMKSNRLTDPKDAKGRKIAQLRINLERARWAPAPRPHREQRTPYQFSRRGNGVAERIEKKKLITGTHLSRVCTREVLPYTGQAL